VSALNGAQLRYIEIEATLERPIDPEHVRRMADVLDTLLDEAGEAAEERDDIDDLVSTIARLEEQRAEAVTEKDDLEVDQEDAIEKLKSEHAKELDELAATADEYRARAEKAEHALEEMALALAAQPMRTRRAVAAERRKKGAGA
jgi:DNA repair exonuclease SbcCD ATPase subunit